MPDDNLNPNADPEYQETTAPQNPPNSIVRPGARTGWLVSSLGTLLVIFLVVVAAFAWVTVRRSLGRGAEVSAGPQTVGTSGERRSRTPGGFDPAPPPRNTTDELEFRGAGEPRQGPMPGLTSDVVTKLSELHAVTTGHRVALEDVKVDRADGDTFWIRDGDTTAAVVASGGTPTVKAGQRVRVIGTVESSRDGVRVRASRIDVR